ncbi:MULTISPECIES: hypothetical protein [Bacillus]|uniref:hypothetical protein n=1 Tax=Bacillus TaxID=1386 RepID=UPI0003717033|nr:MULTISPECIES: hypothetical protein [Bacillus]
MNDESIIWLLGLLVFEISNVLAFLTTFIKSKWLGVSGGIILILSPLRTFKLVALYDEGGFGAGIVSILFGFLYFLNEVL